MPPSKPADATQWTVRTLAKQLRVSRMMVHRVWQHYDIQPHRVEKFKISKDPKFEDKVRDVVGLYLDPPDRALVLCVDEKNQIQALDRSAPLLPLRPGLPERQTHDYKRYGTTTLFAAFNILNGKVSGSRLPRHRGKEFAKFLNQVEKQVPPDLDVHIILDNYGTHKSATVKRWLKPRKRSRFHFHFTPTSSSWLNQVERFFSLITERVIRRGTFSSVEELESAIYAWLANWNNKPQPFVWKATADVILDKVRRCKGAPLQRISWDTTLVNGGRMRRNSIAGWLAIGTLVAIGGCGDSNTPPSPASNSSHVDTEPTYGLNGTACSVSDTPGAGPTDPVFTYTCPLPNRTGRGNLLIVVVRWQNKSLPTVSLTDEVGNTYRQATTCLDSANGNASGLYYVENTKEGARKITAHFNRFSARVAMGEYEFYNVARSGALDQASCNVSSGAAVVTSGALPALKESEDLVFHYGMVESATMITGCTPSAQANITWIERTTMILDNQPQCAQYGIYKATVSFSPSFSVGTSVSYLSASAAFKPANAGTAPPPGIRVAYVQHDNSIVQNLTTALTQMPISGNLAVVMYTGSADYPTAIADGTNRWSTVGPNHVCNEINSPPEKSGEGQCSSIWYAKIASAGIFNLKFARLTNGQGAGFGDSYITFDISGAAANPVDAGFGSDGLASATGQQIINGWPDPVTSITATPSGKNELVLVSENQQFDTITGLTSPWTAYFLSNTYTKESNSSHADLNGGWGLLYYGSSNAPARWTWAHDTSQYPGINTWTVVGAAFRPASQ